MKYSLIGAYDLERLPPHLLPVADSFGNLVGSLEEPIDPLLGPLADSGGPTKTHMLLPGSPAIDMGDPNASPVPFYDQRGFRFARVVGASIDIGAVEAGAESADFDFDRDIDGADFLAWQHGYGAESATHSAGDADLSGTIDATDLAIWSRTYAEAPASLPDFDLDGDFDGTDFLAWQHGVGSVPPTHAAGDANLDGMVDASDLAAWIVSYGGAAPVASGQAVGASRLGVNDDLAAVAGVWELLDEGEVGAGEVVNRQEPVVEVGDARNAESSRVVFSAERRRDYREVSDLEREAGTFEPWLSDQLLERVFG